LIGNGSSVRQQFKLGGPIFWIFRERNFRLLWLGEGVSTLGTQFYMIALPWLVLKLTGSTFTLGAVMGLAGVPRALLLLVGGALTDRFSPRLLMLVSNVVRLVLVSLLAIVVFVDAIQLWMLYSLAFLFGLADAFFYPALFAIMPQILEKERLASGNAIVQGISQLSIAAGPVLAGILIALVAGAPADAQSVAHIAALPPHAGALRLQGIALAFAINAGTFVVSVITLRSIKVRPAEITPTDPKPQAGMLASIIDGLIYVWRDRALRRVFVIAGALSLLGEGPVFVGVPVLADTRLPEGPAAFGIIMSGFGVGSLIGILLAALLPRPSPRRLGLLMGIACCLVGLALLTFGLVAATMAIALAALVMGAGLGYTIVVMTTWLQQRTPEHLMGRMMSLLMLAVIGMIPVSMTLVGALLGYTTEVLFLGAGVLIILVGIWAARTRSEEWGMQNAE
jgi:MFS family permease